MSGRREGLGDDLEAERSQSLDFGALDGDDVAGTRLHRLSLRVRQRLSSFLRSSLLGLQT